MYELRPYQTEAIEAINEHGYENAVQMTDDQFLFDNDAISADFFREGQTLNFIITRSAHLSYKYNEVLSWWGLKKYPWYRYGYK